MQHELPECKIAERTVREYAHDRKVALGLMASPFSRSRNTALPAADLLFAEKDPKAPPPPYLALEFAGALRFGTPSLAVWWNKDSGLRRLHDNDHTSQNDSHPPKLTMPHGKFIRHLLSADWGTDYCKVI